VNSTASDRYESTDSVLLPLIASHAFTQDQIDYIAFGLSMGEEIARCHARGEDGPSGEDLLGVMGEASDSDRHRLGTTLVGNGAATGDDNPGRRRLLVEVCDSDPVTAGEKLHALADRVAAGEVTACPSQAGTGEVRAVWQRRADV
jgi:hypothetical protein